MNMSISLVENPPYSAEFSSCIMRLMGSFSAWENLTLRGDMEFAGKLELLYVNRLFLRETVEQTLGLLDHFHYFGGY